MERLRTLSLFAGCGGMDLGLLGDFYYLDQYYAPNPIDVVHASDFDPYAVSIYNDNFKHKAVVEDVINLIGDSIPDHDLLVGGFPCQAFSIVAQNPPRLGTKDERGQLFFEMCRILKEKKPRFFIAENVKGILSANRKKAFPLIIKEFKNSGYHVKYQLLNSSYFGVPQKRERVIIVGFRNFSDCLHYQFPNPTTKYKPVPLKRVIEQEVDPKYTFSDRAVQGMMKVKSKMNKGRAQNIEEPCNTISSHLAKVSLNSTDPVIFNNNQYRRFTPREAANIQSFPSTFKLESVSENRQYRAIGNAVPPVLMWHIIQPLLRTLNNQAHWQVTEFQPTY